MTQNQRVKRFALDCDEQSFDSLIERRAAPILLGNDSPIADADHFEIAAKKIFLVDAQIRRLLVLLLDIGRVHAELHFPTDEAYVRELFDTSKSPWGSQYRHAICLTGLAGVGKSELLIALKRLLERVTTMTVAGIRNLPLVSYWYLTLCEGADMNTVLEPYAVQKGVGDASESGKEQTRPATAKVREPIKDARRRSWRDSVCVIAVDEFQLVSQSATANTKANALLLKLISIGPRLIFCINYSLAHKLTRRNQEDRQRLLQQPLVMLPMKRGAENWIRYLDELKKLAPKIFIFDTKNAEQVIHDYTYGIKRNVVFLLKWAYVASRRSGGSGTVDTDELRLAFLSQDYSQNREEVVLLFMQDIEGKSLRKDLWCPFRGEVDEGEASQAEPAAADTPSTNNVKAAGAAIASFERRVNDNLIKDTLGPGEAAALKELAPPPPTRGPGAPVVPIRRKPATLEDLLAGADALDELE